MAKKKQKFDCEKYALTFAYVMEHDTFNRYCNRCGSVVLNNHKEGKPYECLSTGCDCELDEIETHIGKYHSDKQLDDICCNVLEKLCLEKKVMEGKDAGSI